MYTIYSILFIVFIILLVVTAFITVALTYFQLAVEDHRWWWRSFVCGGSTGEAQATHDLRAFLHESTALHHSYTDLPPVVGQQLLFVAEAQVRSCLLVAAHCLGSARHDVVCPSDEAEGTFQRCQALGKALEVPTSS